MNLTGKVIVITGAASGIGEACAHLCSQQGARVVLADRDQARGKNVRRPSRQAVASRSSSQPMLAAKRLSRR
jgi:NAD(P)-dependent dehydrogenase (short-subunit alcohol dehydrogenase family)